MHSGRHNTQPSSPHLISPFTIEEKGPKVASENYRHSLQTASIVTEDCLITFPSESNVYTLDWLKNLWKPLGLMISIQLRWHIKKLKLQNVQCVAIRSKLLVQAHGDCVDTLTGSNPTSQRWRTLEAPTCERPHQCRPSLAARQGTCSTVNTHAFQVSNLRHSILIWDTIVVNVK